MKSFFQKIVHWWKYPDAPFLLPLLVICCWDVLSLQDYLQQYFLILTFLLNWMRRGIFVLFDCSNYLQYSFFTINYKFPTRFFFFSFFLLFTSIFEVGMNSSSQVCSYCPFFNGIIILRYVKYPTFYLLSYLHGKKTYFVYRNTRTVSYYFIQDI